MLEFCLKSLPSLSCLLCYFCVFPGSVLLIKQVHTVLTSECVSGDPDLRHCYSFLQMRKLRLKYYKLPKATLPVRGEFVT